jgi:Membrane transport protein
LTAVVEIVLPVFAVILLGYGFGRGGFMSAEGARGIGAFVYYAAIPALLFRGMATATANIGGSIGLIGAYFAGALAVFAASMAAGRLWFGLSLAEQGLISEFRMRGEEAPDERRCRDRLRGRIEKSRHALAARPGMAAAVDQVIGDLGAAAAGPIVGEVHKRRRIGALGLALAAIGRDPELERVRDRGIAGAGERLPTDAAIRRHILVG